MVNLANLLPERNSPQVIRGLLTLELVAPKARRFLSGLLLGLVSGLALLTASALLPKAFGYMPLVVVSGSMEPTLHTGDVAVTKKIAPEDVRLGDVMTYRGEPGLVTHRIVGVDITPQGMFYQTKGDANLSEDSRPVPVDQIESRVVYRIPRVGFLVSFVGSPAGMLLLFVAPLALLIAMWGKSRPFGSRLRSRSLSPALQRLLSSTRRCKTGAELVEEAGASGTRGHQVRREDPRLIFRAVERESTE
jgi:signal peptidase